jgi:hypothetical protein
MTLEVHMTRSRDRFLCGASAALVTLGCALQTSYGYAGTFDDLKQSLARSLNDAAKKNVDAALGNTPTAPAQIQTSNSAGTGPTQRQAPDAIQPVGGGDPGVSSQATGQASASCAKRRLSSPQKAFTVWNGFMIMDVVNDCDGELTVMTYQNYKVSKELCIASWVRAHAMKKAMPVARLCSTRMPLPKSSPYAVPCSCPDGTNIELTTMQQTN